MKLPKFLGTFEGKLVSFIVLIVVILFAYYFYATSNVNKTPVNIEVNATDHVRGNMASNITLVEFGDFQCPACGAWETVVEDVVKKYENATPLRRLASEEDMVGALLFLASDMSLYVTGINLVVDGGKSAL